MKFNIEVELDYIDEEGCLDESIKDSILASVTKIVMDKVSKQVDEQLDEIVIKAAKEKAESIVDSITEDYMTRTFTKVDRYGDEIEQGVTVLGILKKHFDDFWDQSVDSNGRVGGDAWGKRQKRVDWFIKDKIEKHAEEFSTKLAKDTEKRIKDICTEHMKDAIGENLIKNIGMDRLLAQANGK